MSPRPTAEIARRLRRGLGIDGVLSELRELRTLVERQGAESQRELARLRDIAQVIYDREPEMRERLASLRATAAYERAFSEDQPLVSVVIPTYDRGDLLVSRALPSVLGQTHRNLEVIVVGDAAPDTTGAAIGGLADPRIRYVNLKMRGPYPAEPRDLWHVAGIPPRNLGVAMARGEWIAPLDDDDAFHERHIEDLLALAQGSRAEVAYGRLRCVMNDGSEFALGEFPPRLGHFGWQAALFHAGLRMFEMELADALFFSPADWSLCRRMLRAGVRFAMREETVVDHYESRIDPQYEARAPR